MSVSERFMTAMELPGDLSCKAPIITITGPSQVQIENYKSILSYTCLLYTSPSPRDCS